MSTKHAPRNYAPRHRRQSSKLPVIVGIAIIVILILFGLALAH